MNTKSFPNKCIHKIFSFIGWGIVVLLWAAAIMGLHHIYRWPEMISLAIFLALPLIGWKFHNNKILIAGALAGFLIMIISLWSLKPSNNWDWAVEFSALPSIDMTDQHMTIQNFRNLKWTGPTTFEPIWEKRVFDLAKLQSLDLIIEPFKDSDYMAHTMLRFGFGDHEYLIVSVEARREKTEKFSLVTGAFRQFELIYLFGSENDLLTLRAVYRGTRLYIYPIKADHPFMLNLLKDLASSANALHEKPMFYRSILDNCTTRLVKHFDHLQKKPIGLRRETLFPSLTGKLLYQMGYMDTDLSYEKAKEHFRADDRLRENYRNKK